jgi:hypothetical protein
MTLDQAAQQGPARTPEQSLPPLWRRLLPPGLVVTGLTAASAALHFRDPHVEGSWGICPTAALGFWCPGCGGLRSVNNLTNGEVADAASSNLLFVASLPLIAYVFLRWTWGRVTGRPWEPKITAMNVIATLLIVAMVAFTILRNLPVGTWLAP